MGKEDSIQSDSTLPALTFVCYGGYEDTKKTKYKVPYVLPSLILSIFAVLVV